MEPLIQTSLTRVRAGVNLLWREAAKFGVVRGLAGLPGNGVYTYLCHGPMSDNSIKARVVTTTEEALEAARAISTAVSCLRAQ